VDIAHSGIVWLGRAVIRSLSLVATPLLLAVKPRC